MSRTWYRSNRVVNLKAWHANVRIDAISLDGFLACHVLHPKWRTQQDAYMIDAYQGRMFEWWQEDFYYQDKENKYLLSTPKAYSELKWANERCTDLLLAMSNSQVEGNELWKGLQAKLGDVVRGFKFTRCYLGGWLVYDHRSVEAVTSYLDGFPIRERMYTQPDAEVPMRGHLETLLKLIQAGA